MQFSAAAGRDWISTYKNGNFEQQFCHRAGAHTLVTKWHNDAGRWVFPEFFLFFFAFVNYLANLMYM